MRTVAFQIKLYYTENEWNEFYDAKRERKKQNEKSETEEEEEEEDEEWMNEWMNERKQRKCTLESAEHTGKDVREMFVMQSDFTII